MEFLYFYVRNSMAIKLKDLLIESVPELDEDAGQLHFRNLFRHKDPSKLIQRVKTDRQDKLRKAIQKSRGDSEVDDDSGTVTHGAVLTPYDDEVPLYGYARNDDGTPEHEGFHYVMSMINRQYGDNVYEGILDDLVDMVPGDDDQRDEDGLKIPNIQEKIRLYLSTREYKKSDDPYSFKEEIVAAVRDIATRPSHQKSFLKSLAQYTPVLKKAKPAELEKYFKEKYLQRIRNIWRDMLRYSRNVKVGDFKK